MGSVIEHSMDGCKAFALSVLEYAVRATACGDALWQTPHVGMCVYVCGRC